MKFTLLNKIDEVLVRQARNLNDQYFTGINCNVNLFQSAKYEAIEWQESSDIKTALAALISADELPFQKYIFKHLDELNDYELNNNSLVIWFGKSVQDRGKHNPNHIVAHELKHVEQRYKDLNTFYKNQLLDFVIHGYTSPTDVDANSFADKVTSRNYLKDYNWIENVNSLFEPKREIIKSINDAISMKDESIVIGDEYYIELSSDNNKRELFEYYFKNIILTNNT